MLADWESSKQGQSEISGMSELSLDTQELKRQINDEEKITY